MLFKTCKCRNAASDKINQIQRGVRSTTLRRARSAVLALSFSGVINLVLIVCGLGHGLLNDEFCNRECMLYRVLNTAQYKSLIKV